MVNSIYYDQLAIVYDKIMDHVPYDKWVNDLESLFSRYDISVNKILDCGCGTGAMSLRLAQRGYAVTGIDLSEQMLLIATQKAIDANMPIRYLQRDVSDIQISQKQDLIISYFDVINYLDDENLLKFLDSSYGVLRDNGYLIFDLSTEYKMKNQLGSQIFADNDEDISYIWHNHFDENAKSLEFDITFFVKNEYADDDAENYEYTRYDEYHTLWVHNVSKIQRFSAEKFEFIDILDGDTLLAADEQNMRNIVVLKKRVF